MTETDGDSAPRGYSWPALTPTHGAHSPEIRDPVAKEFVTDLLAMATAEDSDLPYLSRPAFKWSIATWAKAEAQVLLIEQWLDEHGWIDDKGEVRPAAQYLERVARRAERARTRLGLDPLSRARLQVDVGLSVSMKANLDRLQQDGARHLLRFEVTDAD
jgi:hypothetical protein